MSALTGSLLPPLGLNEAEWAFVARTRARRPDQLHAYLAATPSLARSAPDVRRAWLMAQLRPFLSAAYRAERTRPVPSYGGGFAPRDAAERPAGPPADWPALGKPVSLRDQQDAVDLLGNSRALWPVRDQGARGMCVPFAANACLEWRSLAPGAGTRRLSSSFLHQRTAALPGGAGATALGLKLGGAAAAMAQDGVCRAAIWSDSMALDAQPSAAAFADAAPRRTAGVAYWDIGPWEKARLPQRWKGAARTVLALLLAQRPVAITIPQFRDPLQPADALNNWTDPDARLTGEVLERLDEWDRSGGHAVCLLGFQPDPLEGLGGWFLIRNSWGERWATAKPDTDDKVFPIVPARGYGVISATQIEECASEIYALA
ncbi:MAG: hypothetical protein K2X11_02905 [Acetobacteraceae bacterium]|nr:hypothetical protein [Acetobacteraceae bacterium]